MFGKDGNASVSQKSRFSVDDTFILYSRSVPKSTPNISLSHCCLHGAYHIKHSSSVVYQIFFGPSIIPQCRPSRLFDYDFFLISRPGLKPVSATLGASQRPSTPQLPFPSPVILYTRNRLSALLLLLDLTAPSLVLFYCRQPLLTLFNSLPCSCTPTKTWLHQRKMLSNMP